MKKICKEYYCEECNYKCSRKFLWEQHCSTLKHSRLTKHTKTPNNKRKKEPTKIGDEFICEHCGKGYKQRSGLWRHLKTCTISKNYAAQKSKVITLEIQEEKDNIMIEKSKDNNILEHLEKENADLRTMMEKIMVGIQSDSEVKNEMMSQIKEQSKLIQCMIPRIGNNNNNRFNINVFLNEKCKNAINMSDFIQSLQIQLDDLIYTKDKGLIEGVSNVFVTALNRLDTFNRPIHCTDMKRETLYIKENNEWERDDNKHNIKTAINNIANKQRKTIALWEKENPDWNNTESGKEEYIKIVQSAMKDVTENPAGNKIIKNIAKEITLSKETIEKE